MKPPRKPPKPKRRAVPEFRALCLSNYAPGRYAFLGEDSDLRQVVLSSQVAIYVQGRRRFASVKKGLSSDTAYSTTSGRGRIMTTRRFIDWASRATSPLCRRSPTTPDLRSYRRLTTSKAIRSPRSRPWERAGWNGPSITPGYSTGDEVQCPRGVARLDKGPARANAGAKALERLPQGLKVNTKQEAADTFKNALWARPADRTSTRL